MAICVRIKCGMNSEWIPGDRKLRAALIQNDDNKKAANVIKKAFTPPQVGMTDERRIIPIRRKIVSEFTFERFAIVKNAFKDRKTVLMLKIVWKFVFISVKNLQSRRVVWLVAKNPGLNGGFLVQPDRARLNRGEFHSSEVIRFSFLNDLIISSISRSN